MGVACEKVHWLEGDGPAPAHALGALAAGRAHSARELPDALVTKYMDEYKADLRVRMQNRESDVHLCDGIIKTTKGPRGQERLVRMNEVPVRRHVRI